MAWRATTCPWAAHVEANLIAAFDADARGSGWLDAHTPLTVWEVGAGTGRLAFHLARELQARGVNARLLITDVARSNVEAWLGQRQLAQLCETGQVLTGVMNVLTDDTPTELETAAPIKVGPAVVLANYLFDSLPHSAWRRADDGAIEEAWVAEGADGFVEWQWRAATSTPRHAVAREPHLFPDGAVMALERIAHACDGRFLLLALDKGANASPSLARHDTLSAGVNFEALAAATPLLWLSSRPSPVLQFAAAVSTPLALARTESAWSKVNASRLVSLLERVAAAPSDLNEIISLQHQLHDDPDPLAQNAATIRVALPTATLAQVEGLVAAVARAADRHFVLRQQLDVPFELATLAHAAGALRLAQALYVLALEESGEQAAPLYNLALIKAFEQRRDEAIVLLRRVRELEPAHALAANLLSSLSTNSR